MTLKNRAFSYLNAASIDLMNDISNVRNENAEKNNQL